MSFDKDSPCLIIAEIAQAHEGSLGLAHAYIDAAASAGVDAVKFQTHIAAEESTASETWRVKFSLQDATRYEYWQRMEFTEDQWHGLKSHAQDRGLQFLSSPFSIAAIELLERVGVSAWKVASGETSNVPMLDRMLETGLPMLISTGMSDLEEIDAVVERVQRRNVPLTLFQCTTAYPCPPEKIGLNMIPFFRDRYGCDVGLSDHSGTIFAGLAAVTLEIAALEIHITMSRQMFGPDIPASVTIEELRQLVDGIRFIERMTNNPLDKDLFAEEMIPLRKLFTKSIVARMDLVAGTLLTATHLTTKKPGTGMPAARLPEIIGRRLLHDVKADTLLSETDIEGHL